MFGHAYAGVAGLKYLFVVITLFWAVCYYSFPVIQYAVPIRYTTQRDFTATHNHGMEVIGFWKDFAAILQQVQPRLSPIGVEKGKPKAKYMNYKYMARKTTPRVERLNLTKTDEASLYKAHKVMKREARNLSAHVPYRENTQGIVMTTGTTLMPVLLVSLRLIRRSGTTLPVEVWLGSQEEYDATFCEDLLLSFNAQCRIINEIYAHAKGVAPLNHYQFKVFSILFSSFEDILFLDADAFPIHDPSFLFSSEPYTSHGLVTWPDIWANTASAHYYSIADIAQVPVSARLSTESGQLVISKHKHAASLLMAVYYNYYGPDYYYQLLCQGSYGAGDKETFLPAAMVMDAPFYQVKQPLTLLGRSRNGKFRIIGMAQHNPSEDFLNPLPHPSHSHLGPKVPEKDRPTILFIHHNIQKLFPKKLLREKGWARDENGDFQRMWAGGHEEALGRDVEKEVWEAVREEACRADEELCADIGEYYEAIFGHGARIEGI